MRILHAEDIDITGFASVRERVLLQDRQYFQHQIPHECWDGFGPLVYLANAWFTPQGSTGLHFHRDADIVSIVPRGSITHKGTLGDGEYLYANQVQIQRSGKQGFSHDEINPHSTAQPLVQIWLTPRAQESASYEIIDLPMDSTTVITEEDGFVLGAGGFSAGNQWHSKGETLLYLIKGSASVSDSSQNDVVVGRGALIKGRDIALETIDDCQFVYALLQ